MGSFGICLFFSGVALPLEMVDAGLVGVFVSICGFLVHHIWFLAGKGVVL